LTPHRPTLTATWNVPALLVLALGLLAADRPAGLAPKPSEAGDLPLALQDDFERSDRAAWEFTDPGAWRIHEQDGNHVLDQHQASRYEPPVRSPFNLAVAKAKTADVGDMVLDVKARSTAPDSGRRDLCFVFGYQDPSHFYYAHLARQADEHHNNLFLVNGQPRVAIAEARSGGTPWDDDWHHVRIVRRVKDGLIQVFFDDMATPVMTAHDRTLTHGRIGLGSFDDTGQFDDLQVWGEQNP
jgi:hypothetical protein